MTDFVPPKDPTKNEISISSSSPQMSPNPFPFKSKIRLNGQDASFFEEKSNFEKVLLKIKAKNEDSENSGNKLSPSLNGRHHALRSNSTFQNIEKNSDNEVNERRNRISLTNTFKLKSFNSRRNDEETQENNKINENTSNFLFLNKINRKTHEDRGFPFF